MYCPLEEIHDFETVLKIYISRYDIEVLLDTRYTSTPAAVIITLSRMVLGVL